jgi:hypothetical protein
MIRLILVTLLLASCAPGLDFAGLTNPASAQRRGAVELAVKGDFPAILDEIEAGAGPNLLNAFDAAGVPAGDRPARVVQLRGDLGLYQANPGALVTALLLFGSPATGQSASVVR